MRLETALAQAGLPLLEAVPLVADSSLPLDDRSPLLNLSPQRQRQRRSDAAHLAAGRRRAQPTLFVVEDLHWVDRPPWSC